MGTKEESQRAGSIVSVRSANRVPQSPPGSMKTPRAPPACFENSCSNHTSRDLPVASLKPRRVIPLPTRNAPKSVHDCDIRVALWFQRPGGIPPSSRPPIRITTNAQPSPALVFRIPQSVSVFVCGDRVAVARHRVGESPARDSYDACVGAGVDRGGDLIAYDSASTCTHISS